MKNDDENKAIDAFIVATMELGNELPEGISYATFVVSVRKDSVGVGSGGDAFIMEDGTSDSISKMILSLEMLAMVDGLLASAIARKAAEIAVETLICVERKGREDDSVIEECVDSLMPDGGIIH